MGWDVGKAGGAGVLMWCVGDGGDGDCYGD